MTKARDQRAPRHLLLETEAFRLLRPVAPSAPVVFSSPHSGAEYSQDFLAQSVLDSHVIRSSEDAFVDEIFASAPDFGAPLLAARAPRAFIDLNRAMDELDSAVIEGIERPPHNPRISSGLGVIPRVVSGGKAIYRGKLSQGEAAQRIGRFWQPYHAELSALLGETVERFGEVLLLDCHSMPHEAIETHMRLGQKRPNIVLGDRFGAAASREMIERVEAAFTATGLTVSRNAPFAGAYITQVYGRPSRQQHAIQIEIDRSLYMDEATISPRPDFAEFCALIRGVIAEVTNGFRQERHSLAAE